MPIEVLASSNWLVIDKSVFLILPDYYFIDRNKMRMLWMTVLKVLCDMCFTILFYDFKDAMKTI